MSGEHTDEGESASTATAGTRLRNVLFGDRIGLILFLGTLSFAMVYWRTGVFITDNETLVRTLEGVSEGHLWIERVSGGPTFDGPGAEIRDGFVYGRNYGQIVASLPALWVLEIVERLADLRVALTALWHLVALALALQLGRLFDREREFALGGSALVGALFVVNLLFATRVDPSVELLALQLTSLVATGFVAVFTYRLVARERARRLAALTGVASVVVLPVGFWATIPKRHVFSTLLCVLVLYLFARSRDPAQTVSLPTVGSVPLYRGAAYGVVGFLTWIHAAEGLFVFLALVAVDLPSAPRNDRRTLAFVGIVFACSMLPSLVTNQLVTGEFVRPPRTLGGSGLTEPAAIEEITSGGTGAEQTGSAASDTEGSLLDQITDMTVVSAVLWLVSIPWRLATESGAVLTEWPRLSRILFRSTGTISSGNIEFRAANLSVLESAPLLGSGIGVLFAAIFRLLREPKRVWTRHSAGYLRKIDPTSVLAAGTILGFLVIYLSKLPLHVQITQRYLLPVYPLAVFLLTRSVTIRTLVTDGYRTVSWSYIATVLLGSQLFLVYVISSELAVAEAVRAHATLAFTLAVVVVGTTFLYATTDRVRWLAPAAFGLACGTGTGFLVLSGLFYFSEVSEFVIPVVELVSDQLAPYR